MCICVCVCLYAYVCMHMYVYVCVYMYVHYAYQPYLHSDWSVRHSGPLHHRAEPTVLKSPDPLSPFEEWGLGMRLPWSIHTLFSCSLPEVFSIAQPLTHQTI